MNIRRFLAFIGLFCLVPIAKGLMDGMLTIPAAAQRALTLVAIIWVLEHFIVPFVLMAAFPTNQQAVPAGAPATVVDGVSPLPEDEA